MKHCPQCAFTFGDDQQVCNFDGAELSPLPEKPLSFKHASLAPSFRLSVRRVVQSRAGLAVLALGGVALSALLIGYYDSVNQPTIDISPSQTGNDTASKVPSTQVDSPAQEETFAQSLRRKSINTQRRITAAEKSGSKLSSMVKGPEGSHSRSARSQSRQASSKLAATKRKSENARKQSHARNRAKPASRERSRQQHVTARVTNRRPNAGTVARSNTSPSAKTRLAVNESSHHKKDSRVISLLKKTGNILKKPFELFGGR